MNALFLFDFDGTIYSGDSSVDFFLFVLRRHLKAWLAVPGFLWGTMLFLVHRCGKEYLKERFFAVVRYVPDIDREIREFWAHFDSKIRPWYLERPHDDDVIISASPEFLLQPIGARLGVKSVIATKVDKHTGKFLSLNCYGKEKINRFHQVFEDTEIEEFYFDSMSDLPMAVLAKKAFQIKNDRVYLLSIPPQDKPV